MALYSYEKITRSSSYPAIKIVSILCLLSGVSILIWVLYPILSFELSYAPQFADLIKPIPHELVQRTLATENTSEISQTDNTVNTNNDNTDYTKASVWFPAALKLKLASTSTASISTYTLSVPKVGVKDATVTVGGDDLTKSLIHFTGSLPGTNGNPVIFGHSTLLWLYDPHNYKTIFSRLTDLKKGDDIFATVDSITYHFKVYEMTVVWPNELSVLDQHTDNAYLTLVTCVPQGTYLQRLVVKAKLDTI